MHLYFNCQNPRSYRCFFLFHVLSVFFSLLWPQYGREFEVDSSLRQLESTAAASLFNPEAGSSVPLTTTIPGRADAGHPTGAVPSSRPPLAQAAPGVVTAGTSARSRDVLMESHLMGEQPVADDPGDRRARSPTRGRQGGEGRSLAPLPSLAHSLDVGAARVALLYHCGLLEEAYTLSTR